MSQGTTLDRSALAERVVEDALTELLRVGARKMLAAALEAEVEAYLASMALERDERGRRAVVRNGHAREREVQTGIGAVAVRAPRVRDRRTNGRMHFRSQLLPPYLRRTRSVEELIPWLYLGGISTEGFPDALAALLGPQAEGLSASTIVRLKQIWEEEFEAWSRRSLHGKRYVYLWVDGIYCNVRLTGERACILVVIGATANGEKELVAVHDGVRESEQSWKEVLLDVRERGLGGSPQLVVGDGALGFWKALPQVFPTAREQRCWFHKAANVLNCLPKGKHAEAKRRLQQIWMAESRDAALRAMRLFAELFGAKYPKAVEKLEEDRAELLAFYDFPAEHWKHLRTTNPIESTFATVRLRTKRTKGAGSRAACLSMVFKLCQSAARYWRRLDGVERLGELLEGVRFQDGIKVAA